MKRHTLTYVLLVASFIAICSSWLSIRPSSEYRYKALLNREKVTPGSVSSAEWVLSKDYEGMTALSLIVVGVIAFVFSTGSIFLVMLSFNVKRFKTVGYTLSSTWFLLGCALHGFVWLC